jgi:hypothetical protein
MLKVKLNPRSDDMIELEGDVVKVAEIDFHTAEITVRMSIRNRPQEPNDYGGASETGMAHTKAHDEALKKFERLQKALQEMGLRKVRIVSIEEQKEG